MRLYFHSSKDVMDRVIRDGFSDAMLFGVGIRLTTTSPVVAGEPVLLVELPDEVALVYQRAYRPDEYIIPARILNAFPVVDAGSPHGNRMRSG
jgi:hypothetical protein